MKTFTDGVISIDAPAEFRQPRRDQLILQIKASASNHVFMKMVGVVRLPDEQTLKGIRASQKSIAHPFKTEQWVQTIIRNGSIAGMRASHEVLLCRFWPGASKSVYDRSMLFRKSGHILQARFVGFDPLEAFIVLGDAIVSSIRRADPG
ncbi:MAG: hypothetical protein NTW19_25455 [Planctomycetota bacterium]|nr:hypothetical protein [Planctomycetota bacterium]